MANTVSGLKVNTLLQNPLMTRAEFTRGIRKITGNCHMFWLPQASDTTTTTGDESAVGGLTFTYNHSIATYDTGARHLGLGIALKMNGTDEEFDTPDIAAFTPAAAISWVALVNPVDSTNSTIGSKLDLTSGAEVREWLFWLDAADKLNLELWDESAAAKIGKASKDTITEDEWQLLSATWDNTAASSGIKLYKNGTELAATADDTGTFVDVENLTVVPSFGDYEGTGGTNINFFDGEMAMILMVGKALTALDLDNIRVWCNAFFDLNLKT
tara:strand:+ start:15 stop:827 length:813 start_codon:yes stop_codon:yes gene_type:complete